MESDMLLAAMPSWVWPATLVVLIFVLLIMAIFFAMFGRIYFMAAFAHVDVAMRELFGMFVRRQESLNPPNRLGEPRRHSRRYAQRAVNPHEIVPREVHRDSRSEIGELL